MKTNPFFYTSALKSFVFVLISSVLAFAQNRGAQTQAAEPSMFDSYTVYLGVAAIVGLVGVAIFMRKKKAAEATATKPAAKKDESLNFKYNDGKERPKKPLVEKATIEKLRAEAAAAKPAPPAEPISFNRLQRTNPFIQLPDSKDPALLAAIEQTNEESEEDAQVRSQALKLLATFRNSNSVTAIAQVALYDLSSKLRSDAVGVLADLDHESVFETIVTACADPTREVRAAAARALFKLSFDRGHAWTRVIETGDVSRMRHAARCAIEGDLVERSFDRLVHPDKRVAYEAFALSALLVRSGETAPIYKALAEHKDEKVKLALLNVLHVIKEDRTFEDLSDLLEKQQLTPNVAAKVNEVRSALQMVHA